MKVIDIDPFLQSSAFVFEQFQITCKNENKVYESNSDADVLTMIGLTGDIRGQVLIRFPVQAGMKIASAMMGGIEVSDLDQMAQSALLELTNMICGNALTIYTQRGFALNITPPTLLVGKSIEVSGAEVNTLSAILTIDHTETAEISVMFEK
ncbi:chemotaxis [Bacillus freudenreichii]|nr:chemotaxis [Bacillus freudenreichii]